MANVVEIIVKATDQASGVLNQIMGAAGVNSTRLAYEIADFYKNALKETMQFAEDVKILKSTMGLSAEEASALIGIAEQVGIPFSTLKTAMSQGVKEGTDVSIGGLMALADEYVKLETPTAKMTLLTDAFGVSGSKLGPFFEGGATALEKLNTQVTNYGNILTEEELQKTENYRVATLELKGAFDELQAVIALELIPTLTTLLGAVTPILNAYNELKTTISEMPKPISELITSLYGFLNPIKAIMGPIVALWNALKEIWNLMQLTGISSGGNGGNATSAAALGIGATAPTLQGQAVGGYVAGGNSYLVGERGPEIFTPSGGGQITPNGQLGGGGGGEIDYDRMTRSFVEALERSSLAR